MFYVATRHGFLSSTGPGTTANVRTARTFNTWTEADQYAQGVMKDLSVRYYAVLNAFPYENAEQLSPA